MGRILQDDNILTEKFNRRESAAFSAVYTRLYDELNNFARILFFNTSENYKDIVQDIFVDLWSSKQKFQSLLHIKNYIYTSIKNKHKNYLKHKVIESNYIESLVDIDNFESAAMVENEITRLIVEAGGSLKKEHVEILKLTIEGYDAKEISEKLGKSHYTVHHNKKASVKILKKFFTFFISFSAKIY